MTITMTDPIQTATAQSDLKPTEIFQFLEEMVIGQEEALRYVSVAIFKHLQG